jgi:hypothetical protein
MNLHAPVTAAQQITSPADAFSKLHSWTHDLRGWCTRPEPVAVVFQAAHFVRLVAEELSQWHEDPLPMLSHMRWILQLHNVPECDAETILANFAERPRYLTPDDVDAAKVVIECFDKVLADRVSRKQRVRSPVPEIELVRRVLLDHVSARETAADVGLAHSGVSATIRGMIVDVIQYVGDFAITPPPKCKRPNRRRLSAQGAGIACYNSRTIARSVSPRRRQGDPKALPAGDDQRLIADFLERRGATKLPPGLAEDYSPANLPSDLKYQSSVNMSAFGGRDFKTFERASYDWQAGARDGEYRWPSKSYPRFTTIGQISAAEYRRPIGDHPFIDDDTTADEADNGIIDAVSHLEASALDDGFFYDHGSQPVSD